jgi:hypothetical protein
VNTMENTKLIELDCNEEMESTLAEYADHSLMDEVIRNGKIYRTYLVRSKK